jgi:hypothetical protein
MGKLQNGEDSASERPARGNDDREFSYPRGGGRSRAKSSFCRRSCFCCLMLGGNWTWSGSSGFDAQPDSKIPLMSAMKSRTGLMPKTMRYASRTSTTNTPRSPWLDYKCVLESSIVGPFNPLPSTPDCIGLRGMSRGSGCQPPPHPLRSPRPRPAISTKSARRFRFAA